ncbi:hypothetical protein ACF1BU_02775 [Streptomyces sp. NPDC014724]|uniref:hypothetical protein n=1 Tax=unclassified Streptomyces TaxID=2593676 RepID=UPI0036FD9DF8
MTPDAPSPVKGCDVCGALARQREVAWQARDMSRVTDCSVELRRHPHKKPQGKQ